MMNCNHDVAEWLRRLVQQIERGELFVAVATEERHLKETTAPDAKAETWAATGGRTVEVVLADTKEDARRLRQEAEGRRDGNG